MEDWDTTDNLSSMLDDIPSTLRGKLPNLKIVYSGKSTIISNYTSVIGQLKRDSSHFTKFISSKLGVKTRRKDSTLTIHKRLSKPKLEEVVEQYVESYIICPACGKPDTALDTSKEDDVLDCVACGTSTIV